MTGRARKAKKRKKVFFLEKKFPKMGAQTISMSPVVRRMLAFPSRR